MSSKKRPNAGARPQVGAINVTPKCPTCETTAKVMVGFCHPETQFSEWSRCYRAVLMRDAATSRHIIGELAHFASGAHIATARCQIAADFLKSDAEWLWMQDTDATYDDIILERLLASAHPTKAPIVGALAFGVVPGKDADGKVMTSQEQAHELELFPTLYRIRDDGQMFRLLDYPLDTMVPVDATGCHCLLIHRSVLEDARWDRNHPLPWFRMGTTLRGGEVSEDMFFMLHARNMGYPVFVNTTAKTGHIKQFVAHEAMYLRQRAASVPPRTERPLVVLIPSRDAERLGKLLPVLGEQGGFDKCVIAWNGEPVTRDMQRTADPYACAEWRQTSFDDGLHALWNIAIDEFPGHDVLLLNDDVEIGEEFCARLHRGLYRNRLIAAVCPNYDGRPGNGFEETHDICAGRYDGTGGFAGFAMCISRDWLAGGGYRFPETLRMYFGDNDLVLSVMASRFACGIEHSVTCRHDETEALDTSEELQAVYAADAQAFAGRWPNVRFAPVGDAA